MARTSLSATLAALAAEASRSKFVETEQARPYAFIQWKGTAVCMDWYCECGEQAHVDDDFAYHVECPHCHRCYETGCFMPLRPTTTTPDTDAFAASHDDTIAEAEKRGHAAGVKEERERIERSISANYHARPFPAALAAALRASQE